MIPIPARTTGNVTVTFGVLSYAGTLRITVLSDPSRMPDVPLPGSAVGAALLAPVVLVGGWLMAGALQPGLL